MVEWLILDNIIPPPIIFLCIILYWPAAQHSTLHVYMYMCVSMCYVLAKFHHHWGSSYVLDSKQHPLILQKVLCTGSSPSWCQCSRFTFFPHHCRSLTLIPKENLPHGRVYMYMDTYCGWKLIHNLYQDEKKHLKMCLSMKLRIGACLDLAM